MSLFEDKLILRLHADATATGKQRLILTPSEHRTTGILPFSATSLIGSQLTVLASHHPRSLCNRLLGFIDNPVCTYEDTGVLSGFVLELFEDRKHSVYNQFSPEPTTQAHAVSNDRMQTDVAHTLLNYVVSVYDEASADDQERLRLFLLMTISFYQTEIIPIMRRVSMWNPLNRIRLAGTVTHFSTTIYGTWRNELSIVPGSQAFAELVHAHRQFAAYLH